MYTSLCIHHHRLVFEGLKCLVMAKLLWPASEIEHFSMAFKCRRCARPANVGRANLDRPHLDPSLALILCLITYGGFSSDHCAVLVGSMGVGIGGRRESPIFTCHFLSFGTSTCKS
jgi:hypothetical protein